MATNLIPQSDWKEWLNKWSKNHLGKPVHIQAFGPGTGTHEELHGLPFAGLLVEIDGIEEPSITITAEKSQEDYISHTVVSPVQVWSKAGDDEVDDVLEIRSADGTSTVLKFPSRA